jgi:hypothetical protein
VAKREPSPEGLRIGKDDPERRRCGTLPLYPNLISSAQDGITSTQADSLVRACS